MNWRRGRRSDTQRHEEGRDEAAHLVRLEHLAEGLPFSRALVRGEAALLDDGVEERAVVVALAERDAAVQADGGALEVREHAEVHGAHPGGLDEGDLGGAVVVVHGALGEVPREVGARGEEGLGAHTHTRTKTERESSEPGCMRSVREIDGDARR